MRFLSLPLLGLTLVAFVGLAADAFQFPPKSQAEPEIKIRCGPVRSVILKRVTPAYPAEAQAKDIQGLVRISVLVNKDGVPEKLRVISGPPELVNASLDAVKQWRYKPYQLNGEAVSTEASVDIMYVIPAQKPVVGKAKTRYFKEDHLTGAMYIALAPDGSYTVTSREHMGVSVEESGGWSKSGTRITFTPTRSGKSPYDAAELDHRSHTFLSFDGDLGPSIAVPTEETDRNLDQNPNTLPPYVFFEISATVYRRETMEAYPFRTRPRIP